MPPYHYKNIIQLPEALCGFFSASDTWGSSRREIYTLQELSPWHRYQAHSTSINSPLSQLPLLGFDYTNPNKHSKLPAHDESAQDYYIIQLRIIRMQVKYATLSINGLTGVTLKLS